MFRTVNSTLSLFCFVFFFVCVAVHRARTHCTTKAVFLIMFHAVRTERTGRAVPLRLHSRVVAISLHVLWECCKGPCFVLWHSGTMLLSICGCFSVLLHCQKYLDRHSSVIVAHFPCQVRFFSLPLAGVNSPNPARRSSLLLVAFVQMVLSVFSIRFCNNICFVRMFAVCLSPVSFVCLLSP